MAAADCGTCELMGYRTCDVCGNVAFREHLEASPAGRELCGACLLDV